MRRSGRASSRGALVTDDAKRVLLEFRDGSPFGPASVRRLLQYRAKRAGRAIQSLLNAGLARPTDQGRRTLYELSPRGGTSAQPYSSCARA